MGARITIPSDASPLPETCRIPESMQQDRVVTQESLAWLLEHTDRNSDQPWFFAASYYRPHFPLTAPGRYIRKYQAMNLPYPPLPEGYPDALHPHDDFIVRDFNLTQFSPAQLQRALEAYYASVDYVDDLIGLLLDGLDKAGCLENTCIVYTADHGDMAGEHGLWWKRTYYEASARVPLLIRGPGLPQQAAIDTPVELVDLFPTLCDWAQIDTPDGLDGESLVPLLTRASAAASENDGTIRTVGRSQRDTLPHDPGRSVEICGFPRRPGPAV